MAFESYKKGKKNRDIMNGSLIRSFAFGLSGRPSEGTVVRDLIYQLDDTIPDFLGTIDYTFNITNPTDQQILSYDSVLKQWKNTTLGSVTITYGNLDGGTPDANYGGTIAIDGGYYNSFPDPP